MRDSAARCFDKFSLFVALFLLALTSCGDGAKFSSSINNLDKKSSSTSDEGEAIVDKDAASSDAAGEEGEQAPEVVASEGEVDNSGVIITETPKDPIVGQEAEALGECASKWEKHPFSEDQLQRPTVITIKKDIQNGELVYEDKEQTEQPKLVLINYDIKNANQGQISLFNHNGWYCLNILAKIINNFTINKDCQTKVALIAKESQSENGFSIKDTTCSSN